MSSRQIIFSILCILCSAVGLFAIVRRILLGWDGLVWGAFGLMFISAWAAIKIMQHEPLANDTIFRLKDAPQWRELSPLRRRLMMLFDWPLFFAIREREVERLFDQPLTQVVFAPHGVILVPTEEQHTEGYFLTRIAREAGWRGLKVDNAVQGIFGPRWAGAKCVKLTCLGSDDRIWNHARSELIDGGSISLLQFRDALESGYLSTLSVADRYRYYR